ncbi:MAG: DUF4870 domain-containing protein [Symploca sp. SIO2B6]|nr:DUF4870 domain-containing protein [Symploca sp. SIO2B6]
MALNQFQDTLATGYDRDKRKLLSALSHGSIFFSTLMFTIGVPITILFISDDPVVKANAKEAINFFFNIWFWGAIIGFLSFITLGLLGLVLIPLGFLWHWGFTIWAISHTFADVDEPFSYPFVVRIL